MSLHDELGERLGPGAWVDKAGALHFSIPELLEVMGEPDTEETRAAMTQIVHEVLSKQCPTSTVIHRP